MKIHGLTEIQIEMADALWACDTKEDVDQFFRSLPMALRIEASTVLELMILATIDEEVSNMTRYPFAEAMIKKVKKKLK